MGCREVHPREEARPAPILEPMSAAGAPRAIREVQNVSRAVGRATRTGNPIAPQRSGFGVAKRIMWRRVGFAFSLVASFNFLVLTCFAMLVYRGGAAWDHGAPHYLFWFNFFSDLGRLRGYNGLPNPLDASLFRFALAGLGLGTAVFFWSFGSLFEGGLWTRVAAKFSALCGTVAGLGFLGVALTPMDLHESRHLNFVFLGFRSLFLAVLTLCPLMLRSSRFPRWHTLLFGGLPIALGAYVWLVTWGPSPWTRWGFAIQVAGQKFIVYATVVGLLWQACASLRSLQRGPSPARRLEKR